MLRAALAIIFTSSLARAESPRPVVVELFTSEGCSSCPDADEALAAIDRDQPIVGAQVIALELHVDCWNQLGWADPFSRPEFSERQSAYAQAMGRRGVYTPQVVVNGAAELVGSNVAALREQVAEAAKHPAIHVALTRAGQKLSVRVEGVPEGADDGSEVWLAFAERKLATDVLRGENAGRHLAHGPVVRQLRKLGALQHGVFASELSVEAPVASRLENAHWVVFVQERASRRILGAAVLAAN